MHQSISINAAKPQRKAVGDGGQTGWLDGRSPAATGVPVPPALVAFGGKAETLERLAPLIAAARVLPQVRFSVAEWRADPASVIGRVQAEGWLDDAVIVRSSGHDEDTVHQSLAGRFLSVAEVKGAELHLAIERVAAVFDGPHPNDQIFVQPMLREVRISGVAFTHDASTGAPYYVVNYDDTSGTTDSVTSGRTNEVKTYYRVRSAEGPVPEALMAVFDMLEELEQLLGHQSLDVEFAGTGNGELVLLQVRPLAGATPAAEGDESHRHALLNIRRMIVESGAPHPYLHGSRTVYGVMPDWNPAEIIGIRPRSLSLSLYRELVTDGIWAYQRHNYGYRNLRSFPLLISFAGLPYIDVRVSFNSFVPADIEPDLAERLVNHYIDRLVELPSLHDKVEFEIIYSCYTLDLLERLRSLRDRGFSAADCDTLADSLRRLTNGIIHGENGRWRRDIEKVEKLGDRRDTIVASDLGAVSKIYWLIEDCKRYGTLPFAGLARAGFIAVQLLQSLRSVGVLDDGEYDAFLGSLETVSSRMHDDFATLNPAAFLERYGHLRPGTYDILSPRYDESPELYFDWSRPPARQDHKAAPFRLSLDQLGRIEGLLREHGLDHDVLGLFDFIKAAIEGREYAKFVFTRSLSEILSQFRGLGEAHGLDDEACSFADIDCISRLYGSADDVGEALRRSAEEGRAKFALTSRLLLPPLVTDPDDVWGFHSPAAEPNFITQMSATGRVVTTDEEREKLNGGILFIPSADPGFDWIFSHGVAGFVTMYGGANSHMAIRAAELGVPAVIGAGEAQYNRWVGARVLEIDCRNKQIRVLQ